MSSMFGKRDTSYRPVNQSEEDVLLLGGDDSHDEQPTFHVRHKGNDLMDNSSEPAASTSSDPAHTGNNSVTYNIPGDDTRLEFVNLHEGIHRQYSLPDHHSSVETEENLKCVVSSLLFVAIVVTVFLVAFLINPSI